MLLPPVRTKKTRSPVASPRKQNGAAGSPPRMAPIKRPAKGRQKAASTKAENMKAENMKFLDKILEAVSAFASLLVRARAFSRSLFH